MKYFNVTYADIYNKQMEIAEFAKQWPTMLHFMRNNIGRFEADNKDAIAAIITGQKEIYEAHVVKGDDGQYAQEYIMGQPPKLKFKSPEDEALFHDKWTQLLNTPCTLKM